MASSSGTAAAIPQPTEDPAGFVGMLGKGGLKKVAYMVLEWVQKATGKEDPVPGAQKKETSPKDFMNTLKDGTLLCELANKLKPGAIETVHEKPVEKEKQEENVNNFLKFAKEEGGVSEQAAFKAEDLNSGGTKGFGSVMNTLVGLASNAQQKFGKDGLNTDSLMQIATQVAGKNFLQNLYERFFGKKQQQPAAQPAEGGQQQKSAPAAAQEEKPADTAAAAANEQKTVG